MSVIRKFRESVGWTQARLAAELDLVPSAVRNYELGLRTPGPKTAHRFLDVARSQGHVFTLEDVYPRQNSREAPAA